MVKIRRIDMLREYDIKTNPQGNQITFSIRFIKIDGESVFLPRAIATGLNMNVAKNRMRGVRPVNSKLDPIGHIYPVRIDNIIEWNEKQVTL